MIGPIAEFIFIPFMTTGAGVALIGDWFGVGKDRGMALLFMVAAVAGLAVTLLAMRSRAYRDLSAAYRNAPEEEEPAAPQPPRTQEFEPT
jgi:DHA3 family multidrug efflux protein-like MFS transporter